MMLMNTNTEACRLTAMDMRDAAEMEGLKWERADQIAEAAQVDWIMVSKPEDILLLSGLWPQSNMNSLLISPASRRACLIAAENAFEGRRLPEELEVIEYNYVSLWKPTAHATIAATLEKFLRGARRLGFPVSDRSASVSPLLAEVVDADSSLLTILRSRLSSLHIGDISNALARVRAIKSEKEIASV
jgi:Xaa-Pro aminopeptidase